MSAGPSRGGRAGERIRRRDPDRDGSAEGALKESDMVTRRSFLTTTASAGAGTAILGRGAAAWAGTVSAATPKAGRIAASLRRFRSEAVEGAIAEIKRGVKDP